jgi:hypothetical protein
MNKSIVISLLLILTAGPRANAAALEPLPPDLPLPASPPSRGQWLREANVLQPYAHSQFTALANPGDRPELLKKDFGFNAIVVLPTDSHNAVTTAADHLTEKQFGAGVAAYRKAGYRLILYTSVMAMGLSPEFQSGQIARDHPDWQQRDPKGNPIMVYGVPWLCPSTTARDYALARAVRIAHDYKPDGILLDNNQFFYAQAGWTCHCAACTAGFRDYVRRRCGAAATRRLFGAAPEELLVPSTEGPLFSLWLQWRNRVWAGINETFRARLRQSDPSIILFGNTQYYFDNAMLATDFQYAREDIVVSESCNLSSRQMSDKMVLGHAIAGPRPLWNYVGTFANSDEYTGLQPASVISPLIAATLAHAARPWIVDGFDQGTTDPAARKEMSRLLRWHAAHEDFFAGEPWAAVGAIISLDSRNVLHRPLIPPHVSALRDAGTPVIGRRDDEISPQYLRPLRVITVETAACLPDAAAGELAQWIRDGGVLVAARDTGSYDELGRKLDQSTLWKALELPSFPTKQIAIGRGKVIAPEQNAFAQTSVALTQPYSFHIASESGIEVVPYQATGSLLLHIVRHLPTTKSVVLRLPGAFHPAKMSSQLFVPGSDDALDLPLLSGPDGITLTLPNVPAYGVVKIPLR